MQEISIFDGQTRDNVENDILNEASREPENSNLLYRQAASLAKCGKRTKALEELEKVLTLHPNDVDAASLKAAIELSLGNKEKARDIIASIKGDVCNEVAFCPTSTSVIASAGIVYAAGIPHLEGSLWDAALPNHRLAVEVYDGEKLVTVQPATTKVNCCPPDIPNDCGFSWKIPQEYRDGKSHEFRLILRGTSQSIIDGPIEFRHGNVYGIACVEDGAIAGFVVGQAALVNPMIVNVLIDGTVAGILVMQAKEPIGIKPSPWQFRFAIPAFAADGQPHTLSLEFAGSAGTFYPSEIPFTVVSEQIPKDATDDDDAVFMALPASLIRDRDHLAKSISEIKSKNRSLADTYDDLKRRKVELDDAIAFARREIEKYHGEAAQATAADFIRYVEQHLFFGNVTTTYFTQLDYSYLGEAGGKRSFPEVDVNGKNVTILVLSFNRAGYTLRLLSSIQHFVTDFAGEVLIFDNGSLPQEVARLQKAAAVMPFRVRFIENGANLGVGPARNEAVKHVETEWFLSLDNDIYLIQDPFGPLRAAVAGTMAHFVNLPLLTDNCLDVFSAGGSLYLREDNQGRKYLVQGSSLQRYPYWEMREDQWFLSNFIFGGAALYRTETFRSIGGFDPQMKIGFEDTEFSLRAFERGLKVANISAQCLVHAHGSVTTAHDFAAEKVRFSNEIVLNSAARFEELYGLPIHPKEEVEAWLASRLNEVGAKLPTTNVGPAAQEIDVNLPRIAVVIDQYDGPYHRIATVIQEQLSDEYAVEIHKSSEFSCLDNAALNLSYANCLHFIHRGFTLSGSDGLRFFRRKHSFREGLLEILSRKAVTLSVFDHLFTDDDHRKKFGWVYQGLVEQYTVSSPVLHEIYSQIQEYHAEPWMIPDAVDTVLFCPRRREGLINTFGSKRKLVVGWVGNSNWGRWPGHSGACDHKGINSTIRPALAELQAEGFNIVGHFIDSAENPRPYREMPEYYSEIDVLVCASINEGTPNPVLEAMACGVPIVSTNVGVVPMAFGPSQKDFIFNAGDKDTLKHLLLKLYFDANLRAGLSEENVSSIKKFSRPAVGSLWRNFFRSALRRQAALVDPANHRERYWKKSFLRQAMFRDA